MTPDRLLAAGLETALNHYLRLDPEVLPKVAALSGKVIAMELLFVPGERVINGLNPTIYLLPGPHGIQIVDDYAATPDVLIRGTPLALASLAAQGGAKGAMASGVEIHGNIQVGKSFQALLRTIDIDWEEQLSWWVGDVVAHQFGNALRGSIAWGRKALDTLFRNTAEYLQEESRDLPPSAAVEGFKDGVDRLRSDTDRLEARLRRLQRALSGDT